MKAPPPKGRVSGIHAEGLDTLRNTEPGPGNQGGAREAAP